MSVANLFQVMEGERSALNGGIHTGNHKNDHLTGDNGSVLMVSQCAESFNIDNDNTNTDDFNENKETATTGVVLHQPQKPQTGNNQAVVKKTDTAWNESDRQHTQKDQRLSVTDEGKDKIWYSSAGQLSTLVENGMPEIVIGFDGLKIDPESKHK